MITAVGIPEVMSRKCGLEERSGQGCDFTLSPFALSAKPQVLVVLQPLTLRSPGSFPLGPLSLLVAIMTVTCRCPDP
jgi:hypothetical protein